MNEICIWFIEILYFTITMLCWFLVCCIDNTQTCVFLFFFCLDVSLKQNLIKILSLCFFLTSPHNFELSKNWRKVPRLVLRRPQNTKILYTIFEPSLNIHNNTCRSCKKVKSNNFYHFWTLLCLILYFLIVDSIIL